MTTEGMIGIMLDPADAGAPVERAVALLVAAGTGKCNARHALTLAAAGGSRAIWLPDAVLADQLGAMGFPSRRMVPASTPEQMAAWAAEDPDVDGRVGKPSPPTITQRIRQRLNLSQAEFADRYGIPVSCVRKWEIRRAKPDAAVMSMLQAIDTDPETIARVMAKTRKRLAAQDRPLLDAAE